MSGGATIRIHIDKPLIEATIKRASRKGLWSACDYIASMSKAQVPLDTSALMRSCAVDVNTDGTEATISYDTPYAIRQHEVTWYHHQRGRKAKYLEDPINDRGVINSALDIFKAAAEGEF